MDTTTPTRAHPSDAGCWIDGHWGQYGPSRLIEIAVENGMVLDADDQAALAAYGYGHTRVWLIKDHPFTADWILSQGGLADSAEEWLNEHIAPEGHHFEWSDGEFFLWADEEEGE